MLYIPEKFQGVERQNNSKVGVLEILNNKRNHPMPNNSDTTAAANKSTPLFKRGGIQKLFDADDTEIHFDSKRFEEHPYYTRFKSVKIVVSMGFSPSLWTSTCYRVNHAKHIKGQIVLHPSASVNNTVHLLK